MAKISFNNLKRTKRVVNPGQIKNILRKRTPYEGVLIQTNMITEKRKKMLLINFKIHKKVSNNYVVFGKRTAFKLKETTHTPVVALENLTLRQGCERKQR